jgi:hypothetical protein
MRRLLNALLRNTDRILKVLQLAALLWIGVELHNLARDVYAGPDGSDRCVDPSDMEEKTRT